ncbi:MAG: type 1 periplasmic binding fold superfamily protein [Saprospiraceae bacterium]
MQTNTVKHVLVAAFLLALACSACKKDEPVTEPETITTVVVHLKSADGTFDEEFTWDDRDGDGGIAPVIDEILLSPNKMYTCQVHFYDRSKTPEKDITEEVEEENTDHLLVYGITGANLTIAAADTDDNGKPFRLLTAWASGAASSGTVMVVLRHEPDKDAANPDVTGEVDAEVVFPVKIQ